MGILHLFRDHHRKEIIKQPFPPAWSQVIDKNVPYCRYLHPDERTQLEDLIKVFVDEKRFEGCGGLAVTEEMKVTVAAQACLLLLNLDHDALYERLNTILIYPESFTLEQIEAGPVNGTVEDAVIEASGLSSDWGVVIVSWPDAQAGGACATDGSNVVLHEFAHQLDQLDGRADGAPILESRDRYRSWAKVLGAEYEALRNEISRNEASMIREYGATKPAEFFAVVTELFFERPRELRDQHPALYEEFQKYYHQDPAQRTAIEDSGHFQPSGAGDTSS